MFMAVKIRLTRIGRHKDPFFRIVAADSRFARDGRYIEQIGYFDPEKGVENAVINEELALKLAFDWLHDEDAKENKLYCYWKHIINK